MAHQRHLLGIDLGSSSVKVSVIDSGTGRCLGSSVSPEQEMEIQSANPGWAEQDPELWWEHVVLAIRHLLQSDKFHANDICAIGISYQMHGLVCIDDQHKVLRPSIIWCDSRAADIGRKAFHDIGPGYCLQNFLNSPGNFTASKLRWVIENEPETYGKIFKIMLPGDYIAMKLTGSVCTTFTGLSEGIFWNFKENRLARKLLRYYDIDESLIPEPVSSFSHQGNLNASAAAETGLKKGTKLTYRAGDQPNNAFSLNVLKPGEIAATAGTSGVIYGITDSPIYDEQSRVNSFVHVNHTPDTNRYGVLLCVNGTGILNSWLKKQLGLKQLPTYQDMNEKAAVAPIGSDGLIMLPFGNGSERILNDRNIGSHLHNLDFNRHQTSHLLRAAQEGIVFSLWYGLKIMKGMGLSISAIRAGHSNMFLSPVFRDAFVNTTGIPLEVYDTDGSQGAARAAGIGGDIYADYPDAFMGLDRMQQLVPKPKKQQRYQEAYHRWVAVLEANLEHFDHSP